MITADSSRWHAVSDPRFPHELDTRAHLQAVLPDRDPVRVWTGFEFEDRDGALHRLDALVVTSLGVFALRTLRLAGTVEGDEQHWTVRRLDGRLEVIDQPVLALRRTTAALAAVLAELGADLSEAPLEPLVFLPEDALTLRLAHGARLNVVTQDAEHSEFTLENALLLGRYPGARRQGSMLLRSAAIDRLSTAVEAALKAGTLRRPDPGRRVGDYRLDHLLFEGPTFQDFLGVHLHRPGDRLRIRRFNQAARASAEAREQVDRAARREYELLQGLIHPGVVPLQGLRASEIGPCLLYPDEPGAVRLDHHLAAEGGRASLTDRLRLLVQLTDVVRFIHGEGIVHRALSPQAVRVRPSAAGPEAAIFTWHSGARRSAQLGTNSTGTHHVARLLEDQSQLYLAPEVRQDVRIADEASDVFSLGAVACFVLSGRPPAANVVEMNQLLYREGGLRLGALVDGVPAGLVDAISWATRPLPSERCGLDTLAQAIEAALGVLLPQAEDVDPLDAPPDAVVEGYTLKRTLGRGATGVARLAITPDGTERVLKLARTQADASRLQAEHEAIRRLDHPQIVRSHGVIALGERTALVLESAGASLRESLRAGLGEELAANLGSDLLSAVGHYLERGLLHRDLKPENMGVAVAKREGHERKRLTLFDFSLAGLPPDQLTVGTPTYRDPFLAAPRVWDAPAELFSAGLVLHEMVAGTLPVWGLWVPGEVPPLRAEAFPPGVRQPLLAFFQRALHRDPERRFPDAPTMRAA